MSVLVAAGLLLALAAPADLQTTRLAGLARVWGQVKYVHPAVAISRIDWDAALIRAIPATESAGTAEDYRRAISGLLAELHDPVTRVIEKEPADPTSPDMSARPKVRLEAIDAETAVLTIPNDPSLESAPNLQLEICGRFTEATGFERVVLDLRSPTGRQDKPEVLEYFGKRFEVTAPADYEHSENVMPLTEVGCELAPICGAQPKPEYMDRTLAYFRERGLIVRELT